MLNIGFIVDHPKRDLPGAVMVAHALTRRGACASLIPLYDQAVDVPLLGLDALVVNYARPANFELVQGYRDMGLPVLVLDTEGGVLAEDGANAPHRLAAYVRESGYADLLSGYLFWGATLHGAFVEASGMSPDRLHLTGCPRFDYASPRWEETLDFPHDDYVLVNANFPLVNPLFARSPEDERATLINAGWQPHYVDQLLTDLRGILRGYLDTISALARSLPRKRFLVRPHPFENASLYRRSLAGLDNVVVDGQGSVLNVIRNSACVLHLNCGTSIEATMLRRLPISLEFLNTPHLATHSTLPSRVSWHAESLDMLNAALSDLPEVSSRFDFAGRYHDYIEPWFFANDGAAGERVADVLLGVAANGARGTPRVSVSRSFASSRRRSSFGQRLQAGAANLFGSAAIAGLRASVKPARRDKRLMVSQVEALATRLATHAGDTLPRVDQARHPWSGATLSSITLRPR